ncbi:UDP-N-acetylglucosamine 4,6-dehydratase [Campylobacter concisus]|uniref:UDP-N-acetylglucosamine 4,6-dehydratase n=1 Tax=Campylobacter concisus TaxID=199 RepID=UPI0011E80E68|nr:UDP-N-acetylglucosamine 4,6-dehydratase [Campylobacter concisus]
MNNILSLIGRTKNLFEDDINALDKELKEIVSSSSFLVIGGAGSIGSAVTKEIFIRDPKKLYVVDISENNLVELVRDIRSEFGYINGDFKTFAIDVASAEFDALLAQSGGFDYVLNLSALKHVRSEKDPFTLMRMLETNIFNTDKTLAQACNMKSKKYFCVSTDKAANPVNLMGASKRIMEMFAFKHSLEIDVSMARFANVAFSDGSLLFGFQKRIEKAQPIVAPNDVRRYFLTPKESGELCLLSTIFGANRDIFFPKLDENLDLITFSEIAKRYLANLGYEPFLCENEEEARKLAKVLPKDGFYPCLFASSDTTGEKDYEEFFVDGEKLDMQRLQNIGIVKNDANFDSKKLEIFKNNILNLKSSLTWSKEDVLREVFELIPNFMHKETGKYLDEKM